MRKSRCLALLAFFALVSLGSTQVPDCLDILTPPTKELPQGLDFPPASSSLPFDVTFGAAKTLENDQKAFDLFSWGSFIALNWPAAADGVPFPGTIADNVDAPRIWETFAAASQVFKQDGGQPDPWGTENSVARALVPGAKKNQRILIATNKNALSAFTQAGIRQAKFPPITDVDGMYVFFEIHLNKPEYDYIVNFKLFNQDGQTAFLNKPNAPNTVDFPKGSMGNKTIGAIEVKARANASLSPI